MSITKGAMLVKNTFNAHFLTLETTQGGIPKSEKTGLSNEGEGGPLYAEKGREGKRREGKGRTGLSKEGESS